MVAAVAESPTPAKRGRPRKANSPTPAKSGSKRTMSEEHKQALAEGRKQGKIVANYLAAIRKTKKKRGRQVTAETLNARLAKARADLETASPIEQLKLTQMISDTEAKLANLEVAPAVDIEALEKEFIRVGKSYAESQGIVRATFVKIGVEKRVLEAAGI